MATIQSNFIEVEGIQIHYLEAGSGDPVVMLHGWPTNAQLWRHSLSQLGEHRRAIAIDLPGYGLSGKPLDVRYSFGLYAKILDGVLAALGIDRVGLAVHDVGGPLGLYWAVRNPQRITSLALLNTLVYPERSWMVWAFGIATYVPGLRHWMSSPSGIARMIRMGVRNQAQITDEVAELYAAPFADRDARKALLLAVHSLSNRGFRSIGEGLGGLTMPLRIIYGERDIALPDVAKTMARVAADLPHAEVTSIPDCGHFLQEDQPVRVAELLTEFFARPLDAQAPRARS
ncbi:MAG: alpha/beta fold hydrolase [Deltaproteobacteria bacterium]|nr:alpha/beta fold hydrolase [Deltaproteobacteria bacterium]